MNKGTWTYISFIGGIIIMAVVISKCSSQKRTPILDVGYENSGSGSQKILIKKNSGDVTVKILKITGVDTLIVDTIQQ